MKEHGAQSMDGEKSELKLTQGMTGLYDQGGIIKITPRIPVVAIGVRSGRKRKRKSMFEEWDELPTERSGKLLKVGGQKGSDS